MSTTMLVIQYEQFFDLSEDNELSEAIQEGLEALRMYGGARIVGSYEIEDDEEFRNGAVDSITVNAPLIIRID